MKLNNIALKTAKLHESAFLVGLGTIGPHLGADGNNTHSRDCTLVLQDGLLVFTYNKYEMLIPISNVKTMTPLKSLEK